MKKHAADRNVAAKHWIREGDWFITNATRKNMYGGNRPQCFEYIVKPKDGWGLPASQVKVCLEPLPLSTHIGPVHGDPEEYNGYVIVRVPSFWQSDRLVWVNVAKDNTAFAQKVPDDKVRRGKAN